MQAQDSLAEAIMSGIHLTILLPRVNTQVLFIHLGSRIHFLAAGIYLDAVRGDCCLELDRD